MKKYTSLEDLQLLSETALESSLAGYWDWNMVTNEEFLSTRFKQMFGYSDDEMENSPEAWQKIAFQEDLPEMFERFETHVHSRGEIPFKSVVRFHHKNGSTVWVRCNGKVVEWSDENQPLRAIGCHVDITEEKELEHRLIKAVQERDTLLKEVHHRVKNNLQLLLSLSRLKDKKGKIATHEIEDSINSMAGAYEAIYQTDTFNKIDIKTYIEKILRPMAFNHGVRYTLKSVSYRQNIDFLITIGLIITELVNNAIKHGKVDENNSQIHLNISKENESLFIRFCDNGKGYGENLNSMRSRENSVGLTIVEGLVEQLNGSIRFFDEGGACAEITIALNAKG